MKILAWHVHGSWMTAFVSGSHEYVLPLTPDRGPDGRGRAETWTWPDSAREVPVEHLREECAAAPPDVVVLQRPHEAELLQRWTGLRAGVDVPAVYVEHNTPRGDVAGWHHPLGDQDRIPIVHVTAFNAAMWDNGAAPVRVIEHGVCDPGAQYSGELARLAMSVNEPVRRWRVAGMDLAALIAREVPIDVHGMKVDQLAEAGFPGGDHADVPQQELHRRIAVRRAYLHTYRWTSLGLSLIEAMMLGCPVIVLASTAAPESVPPDAGLVTCDLDRMVATARRWIADPAEAQACGKAARQYALERFGVGRFLADWDATLQEVAAR